MMDDASDNASGGLTSVSSKAGIKPRGNLPLNSGVRVSPDVGLTVMNSNGVAFIFRSHATDRVGCEA